MSTSSPGPSDPAPGTLADQTIERGDARIHVRIAGAGHGRPLVLLHGGVGSGEDFHPLLPWLADHRCVLMDTRAHGASTGAPEDLDYPTLADDVEAVIETLGLRRPILLGHSDGGVTALHVASRRRVELAGLITIAANGDPPSADIRERFYARLNAQTWRRRFPAMVDRYEALNPSPDFDRFLAGLLHMWRDSAASQYPGDAVRDISCPTLVLGGEADHLVPWSVTAGLAQRIPGACLGLYPYGSHMVHEEHPDWIAPAIRAFLELNAATSIRH